MYRVMLADDEPFILEGLSSMLCWEEMGMEITHKCKDGAEAWERLQKEGADILITDIRMPNLSGLELLERIHNNGLAVKSVILSGYDDFEYVQQGVRFGIENFLLKPVDEVELIATLGALVKKLDSESANRQKMSDAEGIIRQNLLTRLVTDGVDNDEFREKCALFGIDLDLPFYEAVFVSGPVGASEEQILRGALSRYGVLASCRDYENHFILILAGGKLSDEEIAKTLSSLDGRLPDSLFITMGGAVAGAEQLAVSCLKAKQRQEHKILPNHGLFYHEKQDAPGGSTDLTVTLKNLNLFLERQDKDEVEQLLDELYARDLSAQEFYNITLELVCNVSATVRDIRPGDKLFLSNLKPLFDDVYRLDTVDDMKLWMKYIIYDCIDIIRPKNQEVSPIVSEVMDYIQKNYESPINLRVAADKYHINPGYLGQLFKKNVGESFTNYLNEIRVQEAKKLLINTDIKVKHISERVGYQNLNYFYTVFRQIAGVPPTAFRQAYQK